MTTTDGVMAMVQGTVRAKRWERDRFDEPIERDGSFRVQRLGCWFGLMDVPLCGSHHCFFSSFFFSHVFLVSLFILVPFFISHPCFHFSTFPSLSPLLSPHPPFSEFPLFPVILFFFLTFFTTRPFFLSFRPRPHVCASLFSACPLQNSSALARFVSECMRLP